MPTQAVNAIDRLTHAIGTSQSLADIYDAALEAITGAMVAERASILLFDADGVLRFKAWRGISDEYRAAVEGHTPWAPGSPAPEPIMVGDVRAEPSLAAFDRVFARERIASLAFVPLVNDGRVMGKFMLYRDLPSSFTEEEVATAKTIGALVGFAVERTRAGAEAQTRGSRLLFALDAASMGTWEWDIAREQVRWSDNLERIHGLPAGTFTSAFESYIREIHPEDRPRVLASLRHALDSGTVHDVEYRIVAPDGTVRWVLGKGRVEHDAEGRPTKMAGVCMDISDRKRVDRENARLYEEAQQALGKEAAARERITLLADGAPRLLSALSAEAVVDEALVLARQVIEADGYAMWRRHGDEWRMGGSIGLGDAFARQILPAVPAYPFDQPIVAREVSSIPVLDVRRKAYDAEGILSLVSVPLLVRGEADGSIVFYYRRLHEPSDVELRVAVALGHLAAAAISNAELHAEQQRLRREAEASERRAAFLAAASAALSSLDTEENLRAVARLAVPDLCDWCIVDLLDADGKLKRVAMAHVDPAQVARAEALTERYPADLEQPRGVGNVIRTGQPELLETIPDEMLVAASRDPEHLLMLREAHVESAMMVPLSAAGRHFGALTFVSVTAGRRFTRRDLAFVSELARRAALAIDNARLYNEAQAANRLKDEFLATLSHELRTPLNVMLGRTQILKTVTDVAAVRQLAEVLDRNGTMLRRLVDDLLDVSRITLGQVNLDIQPVQLDTLVASAIHNLQPSAQAKGLTLRTDIPPTLPALSGDPVRLQQVVWNVLTNAVKFTEAGGTITVGITVDERDLVLTVNDSGVGIDGAFLPHVFEMFRQAEGTMSRRYGGLGLGLSIVRRLVELHGGRVTAESDGPGKGSTFTIRIPHGPRAHQPKPPRANSEPGSAVQRNCQGVGGRHVTVEASARQVRATEAAD